METKKELQKALDNYNNHVSLDYFYNDVKDIVARMPDDAEEKKHFLNPDIDSAIEKELDNIKFNDIGREFAFIDGAYFIHKFYQDKLLKEPPTKPEPSLLEVAMHIYCGLQESTLKGSFDTAELIIAENERRKK